MSARDEAAAQLARWRGVADRLVPDAAVAADALRRACDLAEALANDYDRVVAKLEYAGEVMMELPVDADAIVAARLRLSRAQAKEAADAD